MALKGGLIRTRGDQAGKAVGSLFERLLNSKNVF